MVLLLLGYGLAAMSCPSGFLTQIWATVNVQYIRCCTELAPGNLTCAVGFSGNTATDFISSCSQMFAGLGGGSGLCNCGAYCTGNITSPGVCTGECLCSTHYCCAIPGVPCNTSSPLYDWTVPPRPTNAPTPAPPTQPVAPTSSPTVAVWVRVPTGGASNLVPWALLVALFVLYTCTL